MKSVTCSLPNLKRIFSIFIIYHLIAVLIAANPNHYLAKKIQTVFMPYWMAFEFASQWNFFAPEPGPAPIFIKYELFNAQGETIIADQMPSYPDDFFFRDRQIRRLNVVRYLMKDDSKVYSIFIPWLCRQYPEAETIKLKKYMHRIPSAMEIQNQERVFGDEIGAIEYPMPEVYCEGRRS
jgi:hypothetical protein